MCYLHRPDAHLLRRALPSIPFTAHDSPRLPSTRDLDAALRSRPLRQALLSTYAMVSTPSLSRVVIGSERRATAPAQADAQMPIAASSGGDRDETTTPGMINRGALGKRRSVASKRFNGELAEETFVTTAAVTAGTKRARADRVSTSMAMSSSDFDSSPLPVVSLASLPAPPLSHCLRVVAASLALPPAYSDFFRAPSAAALRAFAALDLPLTRPVSDDDALLGLVEPPVEGPGDALRKAIAVAAVRSHLTTGSGFNPTPIPGFDVFTSQPGATKRRSMISELREWLALLPLESSLRDPSAPCLRVGGLTVLRWGRIVFDRPGFCTPDCLFPAGFRAVRLWWGAVTHRDGRVGLGRVAYVIDVVDALPCGPSCSCRQSLKRVASVAESVSFSSTRRAIGDPCPGGGPLFVISCVSDDDVFVVERSPEAAFTSLRFYVAGRVGLPAAHLLSRSELALASAAAAAAELPRRTSPITAGDASIAAPGSSAVSGVEQMSNAAAFTIATGRLPQARTGDAAMAAGPASRLHWGCGATQVEPGSSVLSSHDRASAPNETRPADAYGLSARVWCGLGLPAVQRCLESLPEAILAMITPCGSSGIGGVVPWHRYVFRYHTTPLPRAVARARAFRLDSRPAGGGGVGKAPSIPVPSMASRLVAYDRTAVGAEQRRRTILAAERLRAGLRSEGVPGGGGRGPSEQLRSSSTAPPQRVSRSVVELHASDRLSMGDTRQPKVVALVPVASAQGGVAAAVVPRTLPRKPSRKVDTAPSSSGDAVTAASFIPELTPGESKGATDAPVKPAAPLAHEVVPETGALAGQHGDVAPHVGVESTARSAAPDAASPGEIVVDEAAPSVAALACGVSSHAPPAGLDSESAARVDADAAVVLQVACSEPPQLGGDPIQQPSKSRRASAQSSLHRIQLAQADQDGFDGKECARIVEDAAVDSEQTASTAARRRPPQQQDALDTRGSSKLSSKAAKGAADAAADEGGGGGGEAGDGLSDSALAQLFRGLRAEPLSRRLAVRRSPIHGWGLFTRVAVPKDAMLIEYCGDKVGGDRKAHV